MGHIDDFRIQRFRGLRDLKIANLGQINLFVGSNNSGKTSVLEAASLFCDPFNWRRWYDLAGERELVSSLRPPIVERLRWIFPMWAARDTQHLASESSEIQLSASGDFTTEKLSVSYEKFNEVETRSVRSGEGGIREEEEVVVESMRLNISAFVRHIQPSPSKDDTSYQGTLTFAERYGRSFAIKNPQIPTLSSQIVNPFSHRTTGLTSLLWSEVVKADLKEETIKLLRFFDPAIEDVDMVISPSGRGQGQTLLIKHKRLGHAPLPTFGDGLRRVFTMATSIPEVKDGLLLIDELETAIHTKALEKTFSWLVDACVSNNVQLLATTHSLEALDALLEASRERADFMVYLLQQDEEQTTATGFDKEETLRLREELGMEMRY